MSDNQHGDREYNVFEILDEHMDEHLAIKAAKEAEDAAWLEMYEDATRENWRHNDEIRRKATFEKRKHIFEAIVRHWDKAFLHGYGGAAPNIGSVEINEGGYLTVSLYVEELKMKFSTNVHVRFDEEYSGSTWRQRPTGRIRIVVGDYGNRKSYPPLKDGGYSYDKIADRLLQEARKSIGNAISNERHKRNANAAVAVRAACGIDQYNSFRVTTNENPDWPVHVKLGISRALTQEQAIELFNKLHELGLVKKDEKSVGGFYKNPYGD